MAKDSRALEKFRAKWVGRKMLYEGIVVVVLEAANDGSQCDYDQRRRAKPTGLLVAPLNGLGLAEHTWHVQPNQLSPLPEDP